MPILTMISADVRVWLQFGLPTTRLVWSGCARWPGGARPAGALARGGPCPFL
jgi:hypothetical protein